MGTTIIAYDGPPSEPIKRTIWIFPNGAFWVIDLSDGPLFIGIREVEKVKVRIIENGAQKKETICNREI